MKKIVLVLYILVLISCSTKKKDDSSALLAALLLSSSNKSSAPANLDISTITANTMTLNSTSATTGAISAASTPIYYKVDLVSGKASLFGVFGLDAGLDLTITAYNSTGIYIGEANKNSLGTLEAISIANTYSGTSYFKVSGNTTGNFSAQIFNGPVSGNGNCNFSTTCVDNAAGSTFTNSNCSGTYSASNSATPTCALKNAGTPGGKCTAFSNRGAQTLNYYSSSTTLRSDCEKAVGVGSYIFE